MVCLAVFLLLLAGVASAQTVPTLASGVPTMVGFRDAAAQWKIDQEFLKVPSAELAGQDLKTLTAVPHLASTKGDYATALYVAKKFREAGLETKVVPYRVMLNLPGKIQVTAYGPDGKQLMSGPTREHVEGEPFENDPNIVTAYNSYSPSGDVTAEAVYANYGRPEDFATLAAKHISVKGKIVIVRYGDNFRGVKVYLAQKHGAIGVIMYSDPADDGYFRGDPYPKGPYRPPSGVQRGTVQWLMLYPGDPTTPGFASTPAVKASQRLPLKDSTTVPKIPSTPLSYKDAAPIMEALGGPDSPRSWQGALPFTYHLGPGPVKVHLDLQQNYKLRTIWDVIGKVPGTEYPDDWVVIGNHRDAWVYGAVDPSSGTATMLEAARGVGALLKQGWRPKRTIVFSSWDAEEEGTLGSTEWAEQHAAELAHAVAYFNVDIGVGGPNFGAGSDPSLQPFIVSLTKLVTSPQGGTVYDAWLKHQQEGRDKSECPCAEQQPLLVDGISMGPISGGSDYVSFLDHLGVPSNYISSGGPYGVYHSTFDDYTWFTKFADPHFVYLQEIARVLGLEAIHMADADLLPYDYSLYGRAVTQYLQHAKNNASNAGLDLDFAPAIAAVERFHQAGAKALAAEADPTGDLKEQNRLLRQASSDLLDSKGLPGRSFFKNLIYAPGIDTGYGAVAIPGVTEAIHNKDASAAADQLALLTAALNRAADTLSKIPGTANQPDK
jgi:N-acetylated-alpha-linked acidic dipeptidase